MRGIVVEIKKGRAAILSDDGTFCELKNKDYMLGQVVNVKDYKKSPSRFMTGAASFVAAIALFTTGAFAYYTPTDYVSLDVNPSVEYSINMFDRILDVKAVNDNGEEILASLYLDNMPIEDAVKETIDILIEDGYLTNDVNDNVIITTSNAKLDKAGKLAKELKQEIQTYIENQENINVKVEVEAVGEARVKEAKQLGITPGKLNLIEKLQASTENPKDIKIDEWIDKPVKEINKAIKENSKNAKAKNIGFDAENDKVELELDVNDNHITKNDIDTKLKNDINTKLRIDKINYKFDMNEYNRVKANDKDKANNKDKVKYTKDSDKAEKDEYKDKDNN